MFKIQEVSQKLGKEIKCEAKIYWYLKLAIFNRWLPSNEGEGTYVEPE